MRTLLLTCGILLLLANSVSGATIVVRADGSGDYPTIQSAIDAAVDGDVVLLKNGTYRGEGNRDINYHGKAITVRSKSGNAKKCVIDAEGTEETPRRGFLFNSGEGLDSVLEGVTITGGFAPISLTVPAGGAINVVGGVDPLFFTSPTIRGCRFIDNRSPYATAGVNLFISQGVVEDCYFAGNAALGQGAGALATSGFSTVQVSNCVFENNWCIAGGGAFGSGFFAGDFTTTTFNDCVFRGNHAGTFAGAGGTTLDATMVCNRCLFEDNFADERGGAVGADEGGSIFFYDCTFAGNSSPSGGALALDPACTAGIQGCTFFGNEAAVGSAISVASGDCVLTVENTILAGGLTGPAYDGPGVVSFACTDIHGNQGGDWTGVIADQLGESGNISLDPQFLNPNNGLFDLRPHSPCAPFSPPNDECGLIGAWPAVNKSRHGRSGQIISANLSDSGTDLHYSIPQSGRVGIDVFDASGRLVRHLVEETVPAGSYSVAWNRRDESGLRTASGIYFARMTVDGLATDVHKVVIVH